MQDGLVWDMEKRESEDGPLVSSDAKFNILMAESSLTERISIQSLTWRMK